MKSAIADYKYIIYCVRIEPVDSANIYLTSYPRDLVINGNTYKTDAGYDFTGIQSESSFSPSSIDLTGVVDIAGLDRDMLASGVFDNARVYIFATTWSSPVEDEEEIGVGILGAAQLIDDRYRAQLMMLIDVLNQSVGDTYSASCQKEFCGQEFAGCGLDILDYTETGTITAVTSQTVFVDSSRAEAEDYFGAGLMYFTSGLNNGLTPKEIKEYNADGTFTLFEPPYYTVEVGDTYTVTAGCRKREEDCVAKDNILNFGGFSFVPVKTVYARGGVDK